MTLDEYFSLNQSFKKIAKDVKSIIQLNYEEAHILFFILNHKNQEVALKDLESCTDLSKSLVVRYVKRLIDLGYLSKSRDYEDERKLIIKMTDEEAENAMIALELIEDQLAISV